MAEREIGKIYTTYEVKGLEKVQSQLKAMDDRLKKLEGTSEETNRSIQQGFAKSGNSSNLLLSGLGKIAAAFLALRGTVTFFTQSVQDAFAQFRGEAQITQAIKQTGNAAKVSKEEITALATELQKLSGVGDEIILREVFGQLLTFTNITTENFKRAAATALDLSAVIGTDLTSQTIQLGKALNDPIEGLGALRRVGIQFTDQQELTIKNLVNQNQLFKAQSLILDEINRQYGGQAAALASADGGFTKLNVTISEIKEEIGKRLIPILQPLLERLQQLLDAAQANSGTFKALETTFKSLAVAGAVVFGVIKLIANGVGVAGANIAAFIKGALDGWKAIKNLDGNAFFEAFFGKSGGVGKVYEQSKMFFDLQKKDIQGIASFITDITKKTEKQLAESKTTPTITVAANNKQLKEIINSLEQYQTALDNTSVKNEKEFVELSKKIALLQKEKEIREKIIKAIQQQDYSLTEEIKIGQRVTGETNLYKSPTGGRGVPTNDLKGVKESLKPAVDLTAEMSDLIGADLRESLSSLGDTLSSTFARAIVGAESFNQALKGILASLAEIAIKSVFGTLIGSIGGGGLLGGLFSSVSTGNNGGVATGGTIGTQLKGINNSIQAMNMNMLQTNGNAKPIILNVDGKTIATTLANVDNKLNRNGVNLNAY